MGGANKNESGAVQDERYAGAASEFGAALGRLSRAYEADPDLCRDLLQDIHLALWRSFILVCVIEVLNFLVIWLLNQRGAERLQRRIEEL